jgi:polyphosphate glucokinase
MNVLVIDIGGGRVKMLATGHTEALEPDNVVLGGGNVGLLKELPPGCRAGNNANAFVGGFRLWEEQPKATLPSSRER